MPIIAYYHKIAGSKPSGFRQAYLIGLKFKKIDKSADIDLVIDLVIDSVAAPPFQISTSQTAIIILVCIDLENRYNSKILMKFCGKSCVMSER